MVERIKKELKTLRGQAALFVGFVLIAFFIWLGMSPQTSAKPIERDIRTIHLEMKDMSFASDNPTIELSPGEVVRFLLTNLDEGMKHEFHIQGTNIRSRVLTYGQKDSVFFRVPIHEREYIYVCSFHALIMQGKLQVKNKPIQ
ncbi:cupredoxin domain-containing protein [PVC group bacterium]|nr:cupredoxin domain-containing protein [PVC group bacterium]